MENKQYPEHEQDISLDAQSPITEPEPEEELPMIEELHFEAPSEPKTDPLVSLNIPQEPAAEAAAPQPEEAVSEISFDLLSPSQPEEAVPADEPLMEEVPVFLPAEESEPLQEDLSPEEASDFQEESNLPPEPQWQPDEDDAESAFTVGEAEFTPVSVSQLSEEESIPSFMERIPDVDEPDAPSPETENIADIEEELLNDPTFAPVVTQEESVEEVVEQEYSDTAVTAVPPAAESKKKKKKEDPRPTRKGRPKRKKGEGLFGIPNILATVVWMGLIVTIGVTLGRMLWVCAADVLAFGREDKKVTITVYEADTMEDIIDKLYDGGLIRYKSLFSLYADISEAEEDIKPGIYDLNTRYDYHALVNFMSPSSTRQVIELTIPEGYTCRQIFALLEENRVCTAVDIAAFAADGALSDYWFLEGVERGSEYCLEGYLFPDTYQFYKNSTPKEALEKMLDNFDYRFSEEMRAQIDTLNANVTDGSFTVKDVVTVASLIEKESAAPAESPTIASVIYNRLYNWDYPALLNIDAAIIYAQGGESDTIDTGIDSPYNTYRYTGLTPTPIANPGLSSLKAALEPESTNYYYYVLNPSTGTHQFSTTQEEHDGWIREFYN